MLCTYCLVPAEGRADSSGWFVLLEGSDPGMTLIMGFYFLSGGYHKGHVISMILMDIPLYSMKTKVLDSD